MEKFSRNQKCWFITGTDTEIGKTYVSCQILQAGQQQNLRCLAMKPIASGIESNGLNIDVEHLIAASNVIIDQNLVNPYCFDRSIAPHIAATQQYQHIDFNVISSVYHQLKDKCDVLVVEGVGGLMVPLGKDGLVIDLIVFLQIPVILVVGMRLGCLNHALMSIEMIKMRNLNFVGWVANFLSEEMLYPEENLATLKEMINAPLLSIVNYRGKGDFSILFK